MRRFLVRTLFPLIAAFEFVNAQINLGSFNLGKGPNGDLQLGFGQGGSILGFGGDRGFQANIGPGRFGAKSDSGLSLGGDRLGLDSIFGFDENRGLNLGSFLNSGAQRPLGSSPQTPGSELGGLLRSLMGSLGGSGLPPPSPVVRPPAPPLPRSSSRLAPTVAPWPEAPIVPNTPPPDVPDLPVGTATESTSGFATLINTWEREDGEEVDMSSGLMPSGVGDGDGVPDWERRPPITTEGRRGGPQPADGNQRRDADSGESKATAPTRSGKRRIGPPPPAGLTEIDAAEFRRRIMSAQRQNGTEPQKRH